MKGATEQDTGMGDLLMVAYKFPPMHSTSCVRTWGLYQGFRKHFDNVHVISTANRHRLRKEDIAMDDADVHDAETTDYRTLFQSGNNKGAGVSEVRKRSTAARTGQKLMASFPWLYLFGEGGSRYIRSAIRIGRRLIETENITHIFSTFSPYADHIIAYRLKNAFPHLVWIADFRDLHVDPTQDNLFNRGYQLKVNKKIIGKADIVTTVSEGLAVHLRALNPNVFVLRNGIEQDDKGIGRGFEDKFTIAYTGSMFGDKRDPGPLLKALGTLTNGEIPADSIRIIYAGKDSAVWHAKCAAHGIRHLLEDRGLLSRREAVDIQRNSHVNLLLTYSSPSLKGNITGKVYEYLATGRPVITIVNGPPDHEIERLMEQAGGETFYHGDEKKIRESIMDLYATWADGGIVKASAEREGLLQSRSWDRIIGRFMAKLKTLSEA